MKYCLVIFLVVTSVQAKSMTYEEFVFYPHNFTYEGSEYAIDTRDMISTDEWHACRKEIGDWRWHRTTDMKDKPWDYIEQYITGTSCSRELMKKLVKELKRIYPRSDYQSVDFANFIMAFMNGYFYQKDRKDDFIHYDDSYLTAWEAYDQSGDCEDMSILLMGLFSYSCLDTAFLLWNEGSHASAAVVFSENIPEATYLPSNGKKYYVAEATANGPKYEQSKVGERSDVMKGDVWKFRAVSKRNCPTTTTKSSAPELPPWMQDNSGKKTLGHWPESSYFEKGIH